MFLSHFVRVAAHGRVTPFGGATALLTISAGGVAVSLVVWALRGWGDGLACYVATIGLLGALLLRLATTKEQAASAGPAVCRTGSADAAGMLAPSLAPHLAASLTDGEGGLHRLGG